MNPEGDSLSPRFNHTKSPTEVTTPSAKARHSPSASRYFAGEASGPGGYGLLTFTR